MTAARYSTLATRQRYGVTFKRGDRVAVDGKPGTVTSYTRSQQYIRVRLDGDKKSVPCHPTWRMEYLP